MSCTNIQPNNWIYLLNNILSFLTLEVHKMKFTMRTCLQFFIFLLFAGTAVAQVSFSDDFESYSVGDYVGSASADWATWSGATGGAEDAQVTADQAASGSNSIYFAGAVGGGPQDVILPFGAKHTEGSFQYEMSMYIPEGNNGYFNFQGELAPGITWVMNAQLRANGSLEIDDGGAVLVSGIFPQGEWFKIGFDINLTSNLWQVSVNDECIGSFENPNNYVASIDLFPIDENSVFYVDDVSYSHDPIAEEISFDFDASITSAIDGNYAVAGEEKVVSAAITNRGTVTINSFSVGLDTGGNSTSETYNETLAPGESVTVELENTVTVSNGATSAKLYLVDVDGMPADENLCNNSQSFSLEGYTPADGKKVFIEEATGTWCQFCPRGDFWMNTLSERYPERFVGIAVHNNDPMAAVVPGWDAGVTSLPGFTGWPNAYINRATILDPSALEIPYVEEVQNTALVSLKHGATYDEDTRELYVSVSTTFNLPLSGDIRLFVGLTEDGINRDEAGYAQVNAFAGSGPGVLGGYGELPNPVPASQMIYNHVARHMFTDFNGLQGAYDGGISIGDVITHQFGPYIIPDDFDMKKMHIVSGFRTVSGTIDNAESTTIPEAVANGYVGTIDAAIDASVQVFPNPFSDVANIKMSFDEPTEVSMQVTDAMGKLVAQKNYGVIMGEQIFTFNGAELSNGIYYLKLYDGERFTTKRVVISH